MAQTTLLWVAVQVLQPMCSIFLPSAEATSKSQVKIKTPLVVQHSIVSAGKRTQVQSAATLEVFIRLGPKSTKVGISQNNTQPHVTIAIKMPKFHWLTFWPNLVGARPCPVPGVGQMHLEVPWESLLGQILKIHVETTHSEQFWFYEKNFGCLWFFWLYILKCPYFWHFYWFSSN